MPYISGLSGPYTESSITDPAQTWGALDDLTVVGTDKTKRMNWAEQAKWFGANLPKLVVNPGVALTASAPFTLSQNWNNNAVAFEGVKIVVDDDASAAGSKLLQVFGGASGATDLFYVRKDGLVTAGTGSLYSVASLIAGDSVWTQGGSVVFGGSSDAGLYRIDANHLGLRIATSAQNFSVYNTYTSPSVYERGRFGWNGSNVLQIGTEHVGGVARSLALMTGGTHQLTIDLDGHLTVNEDKRIGTSGGNLYVSTSQMGVRSNGDIYNLIDTDANSTTSKFVVAKDSSLFGSATELMRLDETGLLSLGNPSIGLKDRGSAWGFYVGGLNSVDFTIGGINVRHVSRIGWAQSDDAGQTIDTGFYRAAANHIGIRNGTAAQSFSVYGSYTSGSVYNRLRTYYDGSANYVLSSEHVGDSAKALAFATGGTIRFTIATDGAITTTNFITTPALSINNHVSILTDALGVLRINQYGAADFNRLVLGVNSNAFPSIARSTTDIHFKLADNSAFTSTKALNSLLTGYIEADEMTAPAAPAANKVRIYAEDNGAGKTRVMAIFPSGAAQQIAIEP